jgi:hypothetical protein
MAEPNSLISDENLNFLDELFNNLFDSDDLSSESDAIPDLSILDR